MKHVKSALVILPNQLFATEYLPEVDVVFVVEEPIFFGVDVDRQLAMHKQKLLLHRASMQRYVEEVLWPSNYNVEYLELGDITFTGSVLVRAQKMGAELVYMFDPTDHEVELKYKQVLHSEIASPFELRVEPNPSFMLRRTEAQDFFDKKQNNLFVDFYQYQRERFNVLIDKKYKPAGGKWSYEIAPQKLPASSSLPGFEAFGDSKNIDEAKKWVNKNFSDNPGNFDNFFWPTSHAEAQKWLDDFISNRLDNFAQFKNSLDAYSIFQFHSGISSSLNTGLLTPENVITKVVEYVQKNQIKLENAENFIRQIIGWREYIRSLYITQHTTAKSSKFEGNLKLSELWWSGETGILPIDDVIKKVQANAYAHNNERQIVSGLMFLSGVESSDIYKWFMSLFVDAYDWIVAPCVYSLSQLNNLGDLVTKPYLTGSEYILKMSNYEPSEWCDVWDGLYWNFIEKNQKAILASAKSSISVKQLNKIDPDQRRIASYRAQDFIAKIS